MNEETAPPKYLSSLMSQDILEKLYNDTEFK